VILTYFESGQFVPIHEPNMDVILLGEEYEDKFFIYDGEKDYFAETTAWGYRVGDLPVWLKNVNFYVILI